MGETYIAADSARTARVSWHSLPFNRAPIRHECSQRRIEIQEEQTPCLKIANIDRRRFFGAAAMTLTAAQFGMLASASAQAGQPAPAKLPTIKPGSRTSFGSLKQVDADVLSVGYAEAGPSDGPAVILLHGWPYDIHSYVDVAPLLASAGYRVIVPYVRGCGSTRFLSSETLRNGQQTAVALDTVAMMDALKIEKAVFGGYDWGAHGRHHCVALAGALQGLGLRERLSDGNGTIVLNP